MNIPNEIGIAEDPDTEGLHNIITGVFQVVLVGALVLPSHAFTQLEPKLPLKVYTFIKP